jgi:hypothetical protein
MSHLYNALCAFERCGDEVSARQVRRLVTRFRRHVDEAPAVRRLILAWRRPG